MTKDRLLILREHVTSLNIELSGSRNTGPITISGVQAGHRIGIVDFDDRDIVHSTGEAEAYLDGVEAGLFLARR